MVEGASRSELIVVEATPEQAALLRRAAEMTGKTLNEFVVHAGVALADELLSGRVLFRLDDEAWRAVEDILDRSVRYRPRLEKLLTEPAPWPEQGHVSGT